MLIENIPTDLFNRIVDDLRTDGWTVTYQYDNMDAGVDYNLIRLMRNGVELKFEWTNWDEGSVDGADDEVRSLALRYGLS